MNKPYVSLNEYYLEMEKQEKERYVIVRNLALSDAQAKMRECYEDCRGLIESLGQENIQLGIMLSSILVRMKKCGKDVEGLKK